MIQRKQSLYLLIVIVCMVLTAYIPFGVKAMSSVMISAGLMKYKANAFLFLTINIAAVVASAGFAIFLFKNRKMQSWICLLTFILSIAVFVHEYLFLNNTIEASFGFGIALPLVASFFSILAFIGVRSDEKLVKSVDRFRD